MPRKSDHGGEVGSSVGANVRVLWKGEELGRLQFASVHVTWSFVGRIRDEAEKNEVGGIMTVELSSLRQDGVAVFGDDFPKTFREVFVRQFLGLLNEKFNQRDPTKPLSRMPEDVPDSFRLLVLCERLKAAIKDDVKEHLDRLMVKTDADARHNEGAPFRIVQTTLEIDANFPPRGSLQERVVNRAIEMLASAVPSSVDALRELVQQSSELGRLEMTVRLFTATVERALAKANGTDGNMLAGVALPGMAQAVSARRREANLNNNDNALVGVDEEEMEMDKLLQGTQGGARRSGSTSTDAALKQHERRHLEDTTQIEVLTRQVAALQQQLQEASSLSTGNNNNHGDSSSSTASSAALCGTHALRQGVVLEKIGSGERIVRMTGDVLEWRKGSGKWARDHAIMRQDVVNIKIVDAESKTFVLSTRTGILPLRAVSEPACAMFVAAMDTWLRGAPVLKRAPAPPLANTAASSSSNNNNNTSYSNDAPASLASRLQRMSMSFKRASFRGGREASGRSLAPHSGHGVNNGMMAHSVHPPARIPAGNGMGALGMSMTDMSFNSNDSFQELE